MKSLYLAALAIATSLSPVAVSAAGLTAQLGLSSTSNMDQVNALQRDDRDRRGEHSNRDHGNRGYGDRSQSRSNTEWQRGPRAQTEQRVEQPRQAEQQQRQYRQEPRVQTEQRVQQPRQAQQYRQEPRIQEQVQRNTQYRGQPGGASARYERNDNRGTEQRYDRRRDDRVAPRYDRNNNGSVDRRYDQNRDGRVDRNRDYNNNNRRSDNRYDNRNHSNWSRSWQNDRRYDWRSYRNHNRDYYRVGRYNAPFRNHYYSRLNIGFYIGNGFYGSSYWLSDPSYYRLPPAYGPYRWVRYYDDVLLIDIRNGYVVDVVYDFFW